MEDTDWLIEYIKESIFDEIMVTSENIKVIQRIIDGDTSEKLAAVLIFYTESHIKQYEHDLEVRHTLLTNGKYICTKPGCCILQPRSRLYQDRLREFVEVWNIHTQAAYDKVQYARMEDLCSKVTSDDAYLPIDIEVHSISDKSATVSIKITIDLPKEICSGSGSVLETEKFVVGVRYLHADDFYKYTDLIEKSVQNVLDEIDNALGEVPVLKENPNTYHNEVALFRVNAIDYSKSKAYALVPSDADYPTGYAKPSEFLVKIPSDSSLIMAEATLGKPLYLIEDRLKESNIPENLKYVPEVFCADKRMVDNNHPFANHIASLLLDNGYPIESIQKVIMDTIVVWKDAQTQIDTNTNRLVIGQHTLGIGVSSGIDYSKGTVFVAMTILTGDINSTYRSYKRDQNRLQLRDADDNLFKFGINALIDKSTGVISKSKRFAGNAIHVRLDKLYEMSSKNEESNIVIQLHEDSSSMISAIRKAQVFGKNIVGLCPDACIIYSGATTILHVANNRKVVLYLHEDIGEYDTNYIFKCLFDVNMSNTSYYEQLKYGILLDYIIYHNRDKVNWHMLRDKTLNSTINKLREFTPKCTVELPEDKRIEIRVGKAKFKL